ncbi:hypothetical protein C7999DRAFT_12681 [Corynascus novoguineensis]|uniref:Uncharacterized protein n=1 Tax=Corynascus novoguineensis TaxID=1126955 RepID=A0AAN7CW57_9PEZI|nr:hypothetical protein C7999DRAFT_12681 [Corynascus novoguineensis]
MLRQLVKRIIHAFSLMTGQKNERRTPLDDGSPRFYAPTAKETREIIQTVVVLETQPSPLSGITDHPDPPRYACGWLTQHAALVHEPCCPLSNASLLASATRTRSPPRRTTNVETPRDTRNFRSPKHSRVPLSDPTRPLPRLPIPSCPKTTPTRQTSVARRTLPRSRAGEAAASLPGPPLSSAPLTPETLKLILDAFDQALNHTHYAVCGHAALMVWGSYRLTATSLPATIMIPPAHVSILCPAASRRVILGWAKAVGWAVYPARSHVCSSTTASHLLPLGEEVEDEVKEVSGGGAGRRGGGEVIGVPVPGSSPAVVVGFRLKAVEHLVWDRLKTVKPCEISGPYVGWVGEMMRTEARVLAVPTLLDELARAWYSCAIRGREVGQGREKYIAGLILWILRRLAEDADRLKGRAGWKLTPSDVPNLTCRKFWLSFSGEYHESLVLLASCGLYPSSAAEYSDTNQKLSPPISLVNLLRRFDSSRPSRRLKRDLCCDVQ